MIPDHPIDEEALSHTERLALAWYRLSRWEWDEYIGPKPDGFDDLPNCFPMRLLSAREPISKFYYVHPVTTVIEETIGKYALWKFFNDYLDEPAENFDQQYFSIDRLMVVRRELFPKVCKPPLRWRLRQKAQQRKSRS